MITVQELVDKLKQEDEIDLIESLQVTSVEIAEVFAELIEDNYLRLIEIFGYDDSTVDRQEESY